MGQKVAGLKGVEATAPEVQVESPGTPGVFFLTGAARCTGHFSRDIIKL